MSLYLSDLIILFLIKLRKISRITTAEIINRYIKSKCEIYMGIVIRSTIVDCLENRSCYGTIDKYVNPDGLTHSCFLMLLTPNILNLPVNLNNSYFYFLFFIFYFLIFNFFFFKYEL